MNDLGQQPRGTLMNTQFETEMHLELYRNIKEMLMGIEYEDPTLHASYRKMRHHIDMMIAKLEKI